MDISWFLTFLVALMTWFLTRHWLKTRSMPPGPFPLPFVGNLLRFRSVSMDHVMNGLRRRYGGVYTVWFGSIPFVIVADQKLIKEALIDKRTDFAGRLRIPFLERYLGNKMSLTGSDYSRPWEVLRKMSHAAVRKYAISEYLPPLIDELTEEAVADMVKRNEPFDTREYIYHLIFNLIASTIAGERYPRDNPIGKKFRESVEIFQKYMSKGLLASFMPVLRPFFMKSEKEMQNNLMWMNEFLGEKMKEHVKTYQANDIRDMIDSMIVARDELVAELGPENAVFLKDDNLFQVILDLFGAGVDTTNSSIRWLMIYVTMFPEVQEKMIAEIRDNIGDRVPTQSDRKLCPYTNAVIMESMRLKAIAPYGLPHTTIRDTEIGGHALTKGTAVLFHYGGVHDDPELWKDPEKFLPERWLDSEGHLIETRQSQYMPFGLGRRSCVGEKLASEQLFLVVMGIFKRCRLILKDPPEDLESAMIMFRVPKKHTMLATSLKN